MQVQTYLQYRQVYGKQSDLIQLRAALCTHDRRTMLGVLAALNFALNHLLTDPSEETQRSAIMCFFPPDLASKMIRDGDVVFHRHQLLFLIQEVMKHCPDLQWSTQSHQWMNGLGHIFLMANDQLFAPPTASAGSPDGEALKLILDFIPVSEANMLTNPILKMARSHLLVSRFAEARRGKPEFFDIPALFHIATGVQLRTFEALMAVVLTRLANVRQATEDPTQFGLPSAYFDQLRVAPSEVTAFFRMVSSTPEQFAAALDTHSPRPNDFLLIRDKPLVQMGDRFFPLDAPSGVEKFETGVFWSIFRSLSEEQKKQFPSFWGYLFEDYGLWLLDQSCNAELNRLYKNPRYVYYPQEEVCDAIVICGKTAIFIEMKGSTITSEAKYGSDINKLRDELEKKYVGKKGVRQLASAIDKACSGEEIRAIKGVDLESVSTIVPLLITRDDFGGYFGVNAYLNARFKEISVAQSHSKSVTSCLCICSDTLEKLTPYLVDTSLADILSSRLQDDEVLGAPFLARIGSIIEEKNQGGPDRQPTLLKDATFAISNIAREVFGLNR